MSVSENIIKDVYKNTLSFVVPAEVLDNVMLPEDFGPIQTADDLKRATAKLHELKDNLRKSYRAAYNKEGGRLLEQFWADVHKEYNADRFNPYQWERLCGMAWDHGHSSGLYDVLSWVEELVQLIE